MWDHGGGTDGFGWDEVYDNDHTTMDEFSLALDSAYRETGVTFEVIGFDACLMATLGVASVIENYANYMVASEELEPGHGWDYTAILSSLKNNPNQDGKSLGKVIADSYVQHTKTIAERDGYAPDRTITLSVVDLAKISLIQNAIVELGNSLLQAFDNDENYYKKLVEQLLSEKVISRRQAGRGTSSTLPSAAPRCFSLQFPIM